MPRPLMFFPPMTSSQEPVRMIRLRQNFGVTNYITDPEYPVEAYFKAGFDPTGYPFQKFKHLSEIA